MGIRSFCSVLIATRHRWETLAGRALRSVRQQSIRPDHMVLVNDGEPFGDPQMRTLHEAAGAGPLSVLENQRTPGAAGAWNTGLAWLCSQDVGGYVALLDDDDAWDADHLEANLAVADRVSADVVISGLRLLIDDLLQERPLPKRMTADDFLTGNPGWQGSNTFVRLDLLQSVGGFRDGMPSCNDRDLAIRLLRRPGVRVRYTGRWTSTWHVQTNAPALSGRGSATKRSGLRWFWQLYGRDMSAEQAATFFRRAEELFAIDRDEIEQAGEDRPPHLEPRGDLC